MSGAGKSTALDTLEDLGWEVVDNLPLSLLEHLLATPLAPGRSAARPLALGIDSRTRDFDASASSSRSRSWPSDQGQPVEILYSSTAPAPELLRRYLGDAAPPSAGARPPGRPTASPPSAS